MKFRLLDENELRLRVKNKWVEVFFRSDPETVIGVEYVGNHEDTEFFDDALKIIGESIGHIMPVDLVDEEFLELYDGVAYMGGGFSYSVCPACKVGLYNDDISIEIAEDGSQFFFCPYCGTKLEIEYCGTLPK